MRALITGGCGFIGQHLTRRLIEKGYAVRIVDNLSNGKKEWLAPIAPIRDCSIKDDLSQWDAGAIQLLIGDIQNEMLALNAARGATLVVHLAANTGVAPSLVNPREDMNVNVLGVFNYLEACRQNQVRRFVFASSSATIGNVEPPIHEGLPSRPISPYGASKLAGEAYCSAYAGSFNIDTVALRFGNVYGPGSSRKESVVAKFIRRALAGEVLEVYGDGDQTRDFIYIDDLVESIWRSATTPNIGGEVFQIATGNETTLQELIKSLKNALAAEGVACPTIVFGEPRLGDMKRNYSDTGKAQRLMGWKTAVTLKDGLRRTVRSLIAETTSRRS
ncbi:MAG: SDR family NAD(P)-dependent oxidoreductase [Alphaproteobacteria bacterium]|nr:SDR family NAD(P)-dependent oxidoreductase [Alphaproteobacteria bacterium]